jgi:serine/threonine-protein kinase
LPLTEHQIKLPDRYRVKRHVANGGMASVWAARDEVLGRLVAVKLLAPAYAQDERARRRFMREARAAARVSDHPNVVTIYDVGEHEGVAFIVMELLGGGTVNDRVKRGEAGGVLSHATSLRWLQQAAAALDAAHRADIVHRDVKPANLLLDADDRLAVGDFGIATLATETSVTQTGQVLGTAAYISPEQALGQPATPASDRYALTVVAFELLTGRRPFTGTHAAAQARQHVEAHPPAASAAAAGLPPAVDAVLERGMAKDPAARPETASRLVEEIERALREDATGATAMARAPRRPRGAVAGAVPPARRDRTAATPRERRTAAPPRDSRPAAGPPSNGRTATPTRAPGKEPGQSRRFVPVAALAAAALVLASVAVAALSGGGGDKPARGTARSTPRHTATTTASRQATTDSPAAQTTPAQTQTAPPPPVGDPSALQARGHELLAAGDPAQAIPLLQQAASDCPLEQTDPCAYALYDLGRALRLAGQPQAAIPVLQQRLQNPDQRQAVEQELALAMQAAGQAPAQNGKPGKGHHEGHWRHGDHSGD